MQRFILSNAFSHLDVSWTKKDKEKRAPNILAMIRFTNHVISWICTEILSVEDVKERAVLLHRFIVVGQVRRLDYLVVVILTN